MASRHKLLFVNFDYFRLITRNHSISFFFLDLLVDLVLFFRDLLCAVSRNIQVTDSVYALFPFDKFSRIRNHDILILEIWACLRSYPNGTFCRPLMILVPLHLIGVKILPLAELWNVSYAVHELANICLTFAFNCEECFTISSHGESVCIRWWLDAYITGRNGIHISFLLRSRQESKVIVSVLGILLILFLLEPLHL